MLPGTVLLALACLSAQQQDLPVPPVPPARAHHALAFDATRGEVVLYGGSTAAPDETSTIFDDLWSWNGQRWHRLASTGLPRSSHRLLYDPSRQQLLLLGGMDGQQTHADLRVLEVEAWRLLSESPALALREPMVACDSRRGRIVLFGGRTAEGAASAVTWEFDGDTWSEVSAAGPGPLATAAMVYDEARWVTLLFGSTSDARERGCTWQWDGSTWEEAATSGPPPRALAGLAYDRKRKEGVLFGGRSKSENFADTWIWNGEEWQEARGPAPSARMMPAMTCDPRRSVVVLFGGRISYPEDNQETWEWDGERWALIR
jgi:hypothetical protein